MSRKAAARPSPRLTLKPVASALFAPSAVADDALARVVASLGNNLAAELMSVDRAQVSRWMHGRETISASAYDRLVDLDYLLNRLLQILYPDDAAEWLGASNPWLNGGTPVDVLTEYGLAPVMKALDALDEGAYL